MEMLSYTRPTRAPEGMRALDCRGAGISLSKEGYISTRARAGAISPPRAGSTRLACREDRGADRGPRPTSARVRRAGTRRLTIRRGRSTFDSMCIIARATHTHNTNRTSDYTRLANRAHIPSEIVVVGAHTLSTDLGSHRGTSPLPRSHSGAKAARVASRMSTLVPRVCVCGRDAFCRGRLSSYLYARNGSHTHGIERVGHEFVG